MIISETTFYFEQKNILQDVSEKSLFLLQTVITISLSENETMVSWKEVDANRIFHRAPHILSFLQFHLLLFTLRIQIHPLCNYMFFKRN